MDANFDDTLVDLKQGIAQLSVGDRWMLLKMTTKLTVTKPGAKPGQLLLLVDLTKTGNYELTLEKLRDLGYPSPNIRHVQFKEGIHTVAVLIDETRTEPAPEDYLDEAWLKVMDAIGEQATHLWLGQGARAMP